MQIIKLENYKNIPQNYTGIIEWANDYKAWYLNGKYHRVDGPAQEWSNGTKQWFLNGKRHRVDGPAHEGADGSKAWFLNGNRHRVDGPALELFDGTKSWWINGKQHRVDGPAIEHVDGSKEWYLNGEFIFELSSSDQPFLILEETESQVKILTVIETKWIKNVPGLKELENVHASINKA